MNKNDPSAVLFPVARTHGGANVPHRKNTAECETVIMPPPARVTISMQQHIGAPCVPCVKVGDEVKVGQLIGDSTAFVSAPIHASVSGKVVEVADKPMASGNVKCIVIESDGLMTPYEGLAPRQINGVDDLVNAARDSGLVGLGGAGFPAHVKLRPSPDKRVDTLIINAAECEPYITSDYRECIENPDDIMRGTYLVKEHLGVDRVIIAVEENKPEAIKILCAIADTDINKGNVIRVMQLKSSYPQGAEKVLIQATTGRKVPKGKLPVDVGCIVMNVTSVALLYRFVSTGMPLVSKRLTVDGSAVRSPGNVRVAIGTSIREVIGFCGGYRTPVKKILMGGPMMGVAVPDDEMPVLKQNNAILAFDRADAAIPEQSACIRCGRCVDACPMKLMPTRLETFTRMNDVDSLTAGGIMNCMECGCCAFVCPAHRQLVQYMRLGKAAVRKAGEKSGK